MRLGVIGAGGYWGNKWVRNLMDLEMLGGICESNNSCMEAIVSRFSLHSEDVIIENDVTNFLQNKLDGVIIATPPISHFEIAKIALSRNHNLLIEKPMVISAEEGYEIERLAKGQNIVLMTGHTFVYHPAIYKLKKILLDLGRIKKVNIIRTNWGKFQKVGILYDLLPHDLSIANYLLDLFPDQLNGYIDSNQDFAFLNYEINGISCTSYLSWCSMKKERRIEIIGSKGIAIWNLEDEYINTLFFEEDIDQNQIFCEKENFIKVHFTKDEPLSVEAQHFAHCITNNLIPTSNLLHGLKITTLIQDFLHRRNHVYSQSEETG
jgi:predicted dehydrogenase